MHEDWTGRTNGQLLYRASDPIRSDPDLLLPNGSALRLLDCHDMAGPGVRLD